MGLLEFFSLPGQERTRRRDEFLGGLLNYYLGPTGIPERLGVMDAMNPVSDVGRAMTSSQEMLAPGRTPEERFNAGVSMLTDIASVAAPGVATRMAGGDEAAAVAESLLGFGGQTRQGLDEMAQQFVARMNQPGPVPTMYSNPLMGAADAPLVGHHNLSPKGVQVAADIGGIPMPSMAISRADYPLTNFGDVTLLADPAMVAPSRTVGVWPTDVYTGRQPRGELQFASEKATTAAMKADPDFGHMRDITYWMDATNSFDDANEMMKTAQLGVQSGIDPKGFDNMFDYVRDVRARLGYAAYEDKSNMPGFEAYGGVERVLYPKERFTQSGNRKRPSPYTLDAVMRRMAADRAYTAGSEGWDYGPGSFRAVVTPPFRSMSEVQAARERILPPSEMEPVKSAFSEAYDDVLEGVNRAYTGRGYPEGAEAMREIAMGRNPTWFGDIPEQTRANVMDLADIVRTLPAEYFEAKPRAAYRLGDFPAALVPEGDEASVSALRAAGVRDVLTYGTPEERVSLFRRFPELLFSLGLAAPMTGLLAPTPQGEEQ